MDLSCRMSSLFPESMETKRLRLERLCEDTIDLQSFHDIYTGDDMDEIARYLFWDPPRTVKDSRSLLDNEIEAWEEGRKASYIIRPHGQNGRTGLEANEVNAFAGIAKLLVDWDRRVVNSVFGSRSGSGDVDTPLSVETHSSNSRFRNSTSR